MSSKDKLVILLFFFLTIIVFRNYFFKNLVPFPANLFVSYYEPWLSYAHGTVANKPIGFDNLRIFYPLKAVSIEQIRHFEFPLWNPYVFSGNTLLATYQSAIFHPLSFLFLLLPQIDAWSLIVICQPFLTAIFMYFFLQEIQLSKKAALWGAVVFAFSGYMVVWWEESFMSVYSGLFLPVILYSISRLFKQISVRFILTLVLVLSLSLLSGWFQITLYVWLFSGIWTLFLFLSFYSSKKISLSIICLCFVISILLCSIHLFPSYEAYLYSARGNTDAKFIFDDYLVTFSHLITFIIPDFYGNPGTYNYFGKGFYYEKAIFIGFAPFLFALYGLFNIGKKEYTKNFFSICFLVFLSLGISLPTTWFFLYYLKLPFLSTILPSRIFFLSTFCLAVLSSYGIDMYLKKPDAKRISFSMVLMAGMLIGAWVFIFLQLFIYKGPLAISIHGNAFVSFKNTILPTAVFVVIVFLLIWCAKIKHHRFIFFPAILIITLFNFLYFANKYLYFSQRQYIFPQVPPISFLQKNAGIQRIWGYKNGHIENNILTFYHLFSAEGYDSLYIKRYGELLFAGQNKGIVSAQIPRTDANFATDDYETGVDSNLHRGKLLSLLGVKYILEKNSDAIPHKDDTHVKKIWDDGIFSIYEYANAYPRAFLADSVLTLKKDQEIISRVFNSNINLRNTVILEESIPQSLSKKPLDGRVDVVSYTSNAISLKTHSNKQAVLFLSDNYYPGWNAYIDSQKAKIYRADYSFRAVVVPEGEHTIQFLYQPESLKRGIQGSLIGIVTLIALCIVSYRNNSRIT